MMKWCLPQFVNFTKIMAENNNASKKEAAFALAALMEIPFQYKLTQSLRIMENDYRGLRRASALPPPPEVIDHDNAVRTYPHMTSFESVEHGTPTPMEQACPICLANPRDMAFGCGHLSCKECGVNVSICPMCREPITTRLRLYS